MVKVLQLAGIDAGKIVDLPFKHAEACVMNGSAAWPEDSHRVRQRGLKVETENVDVSQPDDGDSPDAAVAEEGDGVVDADSGEKPTAEIEIPEGWQKLHWQKKVKLAEQISGGPVATTAEAMAIITNAVQD